MEIGRQIRKAVESRLGRSGEEREKESTFSHRICPIQEEGVNKSAQELSTQAGCKHSITEWKEVKGRKVPIFRENPRVGPETTQDVKSKGQEESKPRHPRIPPIVTKDTDKYSILRKALDHIQLTYRTKMMGRSIHVLTESCEGHSEALRIMKSLEIECYYFQLPDEKQLKTVILPCRQPVSSSFASTNFVTCIQVSVWCILIDYGHFIIWLVLKFANSQIKLQFLYICCTGKA